MNRWYKYGINLNEYGKGFVGGLIVYKQAETYGTVSTDFINKTFKCHFCRSVFRPFESATCNFLKGTCMLFFGFLRNTSVNIRGSGKMPLSLWTIKWNVFDLAGLLTWGKICAFSLRSPPTNYVSVCLSYSLSVSPFRYFVFCFPPHSLSFFLSRFLFPSLSLLFAISRSVSQSLRFAIFSVLCQYYTNIHCHTNPCTRVCACDECIHIHNCTRDRERVSVYDIPISSQYT